jgi:hypothetical protein
VVDDWARLGDGRVFQELPAERFPVGWTTLAAGGAAYVRSLAYDLEVLARYAERVTGDALIVVLGDHQPVAEVTGYDPSHAVPVHVMSRRLDLVRAFLARGYVTGMRPRLGGPAPGMETFLPALLEDLSAPPSAPR